MDAKLEAELEEFFKKRTITLDSKCCLQQTKNSLEYFICCRSRNHTGPHVARVANGVFCWPQTKIKN